MKLGIMQPYFFPYIGYWQLLNAVDAYVVYDDVNYINRGWINRNRILVNHEPQYINLQMVGASQNKLINEIDLLHDPAFAKKRLRTLEQSYKKAPHYATTMPLLERILDNPEKNLAQFLFDHLAMVCEHLNIQTKLVLSSSLAKDCSLRGQDKILNICQLFGADEYYNAIGGQELYSYEKFQEHNISLKFLKTKAISYPQFTDEHIPYLSIIDVMMFNSVEEIQQLLQKYDLV